jgi:lysozyme family protein
MADARTAFLITIDQDHEGGYQDDPKDRANWSSGQVGIGTLVGTKYGITALDMPGKVIKDLTPDEAVEYYIEHYWKPLYSQITSQNVANKLADMGVLFGVGTAIKCVQRALDMAPDADFGPLTLAATNAGNATLLFAAFREELIEHAKAVAAANPNEASNLSGWLRRINL